MTTVTPAEGYAPSTQQRLAWRASGIQPIHALIELEGPVDARRLGAALATVAERHEALRTRLAKPPAMKLPLQFVGDAAAVDVPEVALEPGDERAEALVSKVCHAVAGGEDAPALAAALASLEPERALLALAVSPYCGDARSLELVATDVAASYGGQAANGSPGAEVVQYADYAAWQEEERSGADAGAAEHWRRVSGARSPAAALGDLPAAGSAPAAALEMDEDAGAALGAVAEQAGTDPAATLLAAVAAWAWRVARESPLVVGHLVDAREQDADMANAIGPYARVLPLRVDIEGGESLAALAEAASAGIQRNAELQESYDGSAGPPTLAVDAVEVPAPIQGDGLRLEFRQAPAGGTAAALQFTCVIGDGHPRVRLSADPATVSSETISRARDQLGALLAAAADDPAAPVGRLSLLTPAERERIPSPAASESEDPPEACIHDLIAERARRAPDVPAVVLGDQRLSFGELDSRANRLANVLRERGVEPGGLVGVCVERSPHMVVAALGVLKAGAGYVPLDPGTLNPGRPGYPPERLAFMLEDTGVGTLIVDRALAADLPELSAGLLVIDDDAALREASDADPASGATPDDVAYAIYTSGSTGRPKAVQIEHRSALNLWTGLRRDVYGAERSESTLRVSLNAPLGFDPSVQQLLALVDGHTLVIVPEDVRANGRALLDLIDEHAIDVWDCTPPQLRLLLQAGLLDEERALPSLVLCGGEAMDAGTWTACAAAARAEVFNLYGPTECTVDATFARVAGPRVTIGRPMNGVRVHVLDDARQPVPIGIAGELHIGGTGVGRGYLNRPELNADRFVDDPFAGSGRLYRTGDLARARSDGTLEFLGRIDKQVKIRSHRIELGEVEAALARHPQVDEAAVVVRADAPGEERLVGYYLARETIPNSDLRGFLKDWLPEYMIPAAFAKLDALPLTPNGKLDRDALPEPKHSRAAVAEDFLAPRDDLEREFADIWANVLAIEPDEIGVRDNFFDDLGGDSLKAVDVVNELEHAMGGQLPLDLMVQYPTVDELAGALRARDARPDPVA
jgi:amino acid adenylation domain-containing protein